MPTSSGFKSELEGKEFFFAADGKTNPQAELKASAAAFHTTKPVGRFKLHPQCAFPERFRFFREVLNISYQTVPCPKFQEFLDGFHNPTGVTLVFSSAYPNNPASMFGHTFLKFESTRKSNLLHTGVNFAAYTPPGANMLAFMYKGVFGGYPGMWSMEPYFQKVNEYINAESRDIWEYELTLTEIETMRLLGHLWELETNSYFDYYFFDENCSYQILRAIEAIKLDWDISRFRLIYVIPGETIKRISETPGAVRDVRFRPSLFHQLENRYATLTSLRDREDFRGLLDGQDFAQPPSPEAFDAAFLAFLYNKAKKKGKITTAAQEAENKALDLRRRQVELPREVVIPEEQLKTRPELGHHPTSIHTAGAWLDSPLSKGSFTGRLKLRSSYHDLLASDIGFSPFSEIEFPWIEAEWREDNLRLQELGFVNTTSLFPLSSFDKRASWRVRIAADTERARECFNCLLPGIESGAGAAIGGTSWRVYALGLGRADFSSRLKYGYRLRPVFELGAVAKISDAYKTRLTSRGLWSTISGDQQRVYEFKWDHSLALSRNHELRQINLLNYTNTLDQTPNVEIRLEWIQYFR